MVVTKGEMRRRGKLRVQSAESDEGSWQDGGGRRRSGAVGRSGRCKDWRDWKWTPFFRNETVLGLVGDINKKRGW